MSESKKVAWNTSQGLIIEISNRRSYANNFYVNGDIRKAFNTLIAIKQSVIQSFVEKERQELAVMEEWFNKINFALSRANSMSFNQETRKNFFNARAIAVKIYSKYNNRLMDLLDDRGYLIGEQTDASRMKF